MLRNIAAVIALSLCTISPTLAETFPASDPIAVDPDEPHRTPVARQKEKAGAAKQPAQRSTRPKHH